MGCNNNCGSCGSGVKKEVEPCEECKGKGNYEILNAYDLESKREVTCEYCGGSGKKNPNIRSVTLEELISEGCAWDGKCADC